MDFSAGDPGRTGSESGSGGTSADGGRGRSRTRKHGGANSAESSASEGGKRRFRHPTGREFDGRGAPRNGRRKPRRVSSRGTGDREPSPFPRPPTTPSGARAHGPQSGPRFFDARRPPGGGAERALAARLRAASRRASSQAAELVRAGAEKAALRAAVRALRSRLLAARRCAAAAESRRLSERRRQAQDFELRVLAERLRRERETGDLRRRVRDLEYERDRERQKAGLAERLLEERREAERGELARCLVAVIDVNRRSTNFSLETMARKLSAQSGPVRRVSRQGRVLARPLCLTVICEAARGEEGGRAGRCGAGLGAYCRPRASRRLLQFPSAFRALSSPWQQPTPRFPVPPPPPPPLPRTGGELTAGGEKRERERDLPPFSPPNTKAPEGASDAPRHDEQAAAAASSRDLLVSLALCAGRTGAAATPATTIAGDRPDEVWSPLRHRSLSTVSPPAPASLGTRPATCAPSGLKLAGAPSKHAKNKALNSAVPAPAPGALGAGAADAGKATAAVAERADVVKVYRTYVNPGLSPTCGAVTGSTKCEHPSNPEAYTVTIKVRRRNTFISLNNPTGKEVTHASLGHLGYRNSGKRGYEPSYQLGVHLAEKVASSRIPVHSVEIVFKGFGPGREAALRGFISACRHQVIRLTDRTWVKWSDWPRSRRRPRK
ncbi:MAG: hypothetical protein BJ554DRAFT_480 [Olpidium bornovanus]|uniref:Ribosomal protein S11 n=1 Tax=Olpidium bornovanus TaxID=278681 RepID=A0A8H7ZUB4_9FUNG|nr:MAG: hypothetical protein BJ554DRAFT_480 [Olpidium bornovanus]